MITENDLNRLLNSVCQWYSQASTEPFEEQGGFILQHKNGVDWKFVPVRSLVAGTRQAAGLYLADPEAYAELICGKDGLAGGWRPFASFHTHPPGYGPIPSQLDINKLFRSFPTNIIFSPDMLLAVRYDFDKETNTWQPQVLNLT